MHYGKRPSGILWISRLMVSLSYFTILKGKPVSELHPTLLMQLAGEEYCVCFS